MCRPNGTGFRAFLVRNGYTLCPFWSGIGYGFRGNYGIVWKYLSFQFQMSKKERDICQFEMDFWQCFCLRSNLSNDGRISALRPSLKTGVENDVIFLSSVKELQFLFHRSEFTFVDITIDDVQVARTFSGTIWVEGMGEEKLYFLVF